MESVHRQSGSIKLVKRVAETPKFFLSPSVSGARWSQFAAVVRLVFVDWGNGAVTGHTDRRDRRVAK